MTREEAIEFIARSVKSDVDMSKIADTIKALEQYPRCKDCKWWKDSDGKYRRGCGAESQCPINTHAVYSGEGYCYKFSPKNI